MRHNSETTKMTTSIMLLALVIFCAVLSVTTCNSSTDWSSEVKYASKEELKELEISRHLEIERQKMVILRKLGKTKPPVFANASRHQLPKHAIQMWMNYDSVQPPTEPEGNIAQVVIFPRNRKFVCHWNRSAPCRRFEFAVPPDVLRSPAELAVRRLENGSAKATVSVFHSQPKRKEEMAERKKLVVGASEDEWLSFRLKAFEKVKFWMVNVTFAVEIMGLPVDDAEPNLPFLNLKKDMTAQSRERKSDQHKNRNRGCHKVPFNVSFHDIGFGDWIIHPPYYEANVCKGYCTHVQNHHENFMEHVFMNNKTLEKEYGGCWLTCCRPKKFATLSMIYRDSLSEETYIQTNMTNMIVTDCSCS